MQLYSCTLSLVVTSGGMGRLLSPNLFLWLEGNIIAKKAHITVVSPEDSSRVQSTFSAKGLELEVSFESVQPFIEALYAANFPSPSVEEGLDTSDYAQQAIIAASIFSGERKQESAMLQMSGMAGSYRGKDAAAMQRAMTMLLTLAQITPSHKAWSFLTGRYE